MLSLVHAPGAAVSGILESSIHDSAREASASSLPSLKWTDIVFVSEIGHGTSGVVHKCRSGSASWEL